MAATLEQSLRAREVMRQEAGLGPEQFDDEEVVRMLSDEIVALREKGRSDEEIARLAKDKAGLELSAESIRRHMSANERQERAA